MLDVPTELRVYANPGETYQRLHNKTVAFNFEVWRGTPDKRCLASNYAVCETDGAECVPTQTAPLKDFGSVGFVGRSGWYIPLSSVRSGAQRFELRNYHNLDPGQGTLELLPTLAEAQKAAKEFGFASSSLFVPPQCQGGALASGACRVAFKTSPALDTAYERAQLKSDQRIKLAVMYTGASVAEEAGFRALLRAAETRGTPVMFYWWQPSELISSNTSRFLRMEFEDPRYCDAEQRAELEAWLPPAGVTCDFIGDRTSKIGVALGVRSDVAYFASALRVTPAELRAMMTSVLHTNTSAAEMIYDENDDGQLTTTDEIARAVACRFVRDNEEELRGRWLRNSRRADELRCLDKNTFEDCIVVWVTDHSSAWTVASICIMAFLLYWFMVPLWYVEESMCDTASYDTLYTPFIHLHYYMYTYVHLLYMYIHHINTFNTLETPFKHPIYTLYTPLHARYLDKCTLEETLTFIDRYGPALALTMTITDIHLPDEFAYKGYYISAQVMEGELLRTAQVKSL